MTNTVSLESVQNIDELKNLLTNRSRIVITTHQNPDGDAMGSVLALSLFLKKNGHDVRAIVPNEYPEFLQWLPDNNEVISYHRGKKSADEIISKADIIFQLDYNDPKRSSEMKDIIASSKGKKIMIDHHPYPQMTVDFSISFTQVSSTSELIYEFIVALNGQEFMDKSIATCLYVGIMTDTGCFSYNSSHSRTFEIVAQLLKHKIEKDEIYRHVYESFSVHRMRLFGYCLNEKMQVFPEYHTAFISISLEEQKRYEFTTGDSEGFVNLPLSIKDIWFSAFFMEKKDKIKISFRSRGKFPVNAFSEKYFSGGGHLNASGGESELTLNETIKKFVALLPQLSKELEA
jgi:bifunctional oligoribonuclease and PAP phosphatase NrnA